ncbi:flagellar hook-basal body complex protein, partial [Jeotgalibaca porci]
MKNLQTKMDVISNNISNVNTTSFKTGRVRFEDMISQSLEGAQANINGKQVGLGMQLGSIDTVMTSGSLQSTGRDLDFGIETGENSFFAVSSNGTDADVLYTRDGGFYMNEDNEFITASGYQVLGRMLDVPVEYTGTTPAALETGNLQGISIPQLNNGIKLDSYSVDSSGLILGVYNDKVMVVGQMMLTNFSNAGGL